MADFESRQEFQPQLRLWPSARRQRWVRTYIMFAGCAMYSGCIFLLAMGTGPTGYHALMPKKSATDPIMLFDVIAAVSVVTGVMSCYGVVLCNRLAVMGGELDGGELGASARYFCFWSCGVACILMATSATAMYAALMLEPQKDLLLPAMQMYGAEDDGEIQMTFDLLQSSLHCCGSDRYDEWFDYLWMPAYNLVVGVEVGFPESCCDSSGSSSPSSVSSQAAAAMAASGGGGSHRCSWAVAQTERDRLTPFPVGCANALNKQIRQAMMWLFLFVCPLTIVYCWLSISCIRTISSGERTLEDDVDAERHKRLEKKRQRLDKKLRNLKVVRRAAQAAERAAQRRLQMTEASVQRRIARAHLSVQERVERATEEAAKEASKREVASQRLISEQIEAARSDAFEREQRRRVDAFDRKQQVDDEERTVRLEQERARVKQQEAVAELEKVQAAKELASVGLDRSGHLIPQQQSWAPPYGMQMPYSPMAPPPGFYPGSSPQRRSRSGSGSRSGSS